MGRPLASVWRPQSVGYARRRCGESSLGPGFESPRLHYLDVSHKLTAPQMMGCRVVFRRRSRSYSLDSARLGAARTTIIDLRFQITDSLEGLCVHDCRSTSLLPPCSRYWSWGPSLAQGSKPSGAATPQEAVAMINKASTANDFLLALPVISPAASRSLPAKA